MRTGLVAAGFVLVAILAATISAWVVNISRPPIAVNLASASSGVSAVPLGDSATGHADTLAGSIDNPLANDAAAIADGKRLFRQMNCAGCHGYGAKGGMGPDLTDTYWRYGGKPAEIYKSIAQGRPQGMPTWEHTLPDRQIWELVAYVQSLHSPEHAVENAAADPGENRGASQ